MISIIIVTFNSEKVIQKCLQSISSQLEEGEVIVMDNSSSEETQRIVSQFKVARYIDSKANIGFTKACNIGAGQAQGEVLLFLNPDTELKKGALAILLDFAALHSDFGIIAPRLIQSDGQTQLSVRRFPTLVGLFKQYYLNQKYEYDPYFPKGDEAVEVDSVVGAAILIKKVIFEKVGKWDERYFMYYEDLEICKRVRRLGLKIYVLPKAHFYHEVGGSFSAAKDKIIKKSFYTYHGILEGCLMSILLYLRPDNLRRISKKLV